MNELFSISLFVEVSICFGIGNKLSPLTIGGRTVSTKEAGTCGSTNGKMIGIVL
jgi:hypothetical protein